MILALIVLVTVVWTVALQELRHAALERAQWKLYAIRDELRRLAIQGGDSLNGEIFTELDSSISQLCSIVRDGYFSLWTLLPAMSTAMQDRRNEREQLRFRAAIEGDPHCQKLAEAFEASVAVAVKVLIWRHLFLFVLFTPTIVGVFVLYYVCRHLAQAVLSTPILAGPFSSGQLVTSGGHFWRE